MTYALGYLRAHVHAALVCKHAAKETMLVLPLYLSEALAELQSKKDGRWLHLILAATAMRELG